MDSSGSELGLVTGACERGSKTSGSIKGEEFFDQPKKNIWSGTISFKFEISGRYTKECDMTGNKNPRNITCY